MTTEKQTEANKRNATLSTGPTSTGGLGRASQNAVKHGLTAAGVLLKGEDSVVFEKLRQDLLDYYKPIGEIEAFWVEHVAINLWRLGRGPKYEAAMVEEAQRAVDKEFMLERALSMTEVRGAVEQEKKPEAGAAYFRLFSYQGSNGSLINLTRHEERIERSISRGLVQLERLQARRRGENFAPPIKLEVTHRYEEAAERREPDGRNSSNIVTLPVTESDQPSEGSSPRVRHRVRPA
jgi:hypothetical protein